MQAEVHQITCCHDQEEDEEDFSEALDGLDGFDGLAGLGGGALDFQAESLFSTPASACWYMRWIKIVYYHDHVYVYTIPVRVSARKLEPLTAQNRSNFLPVLSQPCIEQLPVRRLAFSKSSPEDPKSLRKLGHIVWQTIANLTFGEFKFGHRKILDFLQTSQDPQC